MKKEGVYHKKNVLVMASFLFFGVLALALVGAGLISYTFDGESVKDNFNVNGPVFFLDVFQGILLTGEDRGEVPSEGGEGGGNGGLFLHRLLLNENPDSSGEVIINGGNRQLFASDAVGVDGFYPVTFDITIWAKSNTSGDEIGFRVLRMDEVFNEEVICNAGNVSVGAVSSFTKYIASCGTNVAIVNLTSTDIFVLETKSLADFEGFHIISTGTERTNGMSRMQIRPFSEPIEIPETNETNSSLFLGGFTDE